MKRQRNILNFLRKIPRTESSVEEATEIATDDIHPPLMNNANATSASDMSTVNTVSPADQADATATCDKCIATTVSSEIRKMQQHLCQTAGVQCNTRIF